MLLYIYNNAIRSFEIDFEKKNILENLRSFFKLFCCYSDVCKWNSKATDKIVFSSKLTSNIHTVSAFLFINCLVSFPQLNWTMSIPSILLLQGRHLVDDTGSKKIQIGKKYKPLRKLL